MDVKNKAQIEDVVSGGDPSQKIVFGAAGALSQMS
jgi:hypothetical protein